MEPTLYEIDPNGDTLLILHNANAPFAVLPCSEPQEKQSQTDSCPDETAPSERQDADGSEPEAAAAASPSAPKDADADPEPTTIRMRLSSKHLTLASAYFQKLTANNWQETTPKDGYAYVINAHDWDEKALLILMNMLHGRTAKIPRSVGLETFAKIAVLVDYYQCHEAVQFFAQTWLGSTAIAIPKEGERDFMLRLVVARVFSEDFNFLLLTKTVIQTSSAPVDSLGLPIGEDIIDAINKKREDAISSAFSELRALRKRLTGDQAECTFECSSIMLGALLKSLTKLRLVDPVPKPPYLGISLLTLESDICDFQEPSWKPNCLAVSSSSSQAAASTKPAPAQTATTTNTSTPTAVFTFNPVPRTNASPSGATVGFAPAASRAASLFPAVAKPGTSPTPSPNPACTLFQNTKPIIDELRKLKGLRLTDHVKS